MKAANFFAKLINDHLQMQLEKCSPNFIGAKYFLTAENVFRSDKNASWPNIYDEQGQGTYVGVDDINPMMIYHRCLAIGFSTNAARPGFGDREDRVGLFQMRMAVYGDRQRLHLTNDELGMLIYANMPAIFQNLPNFGNVVIRTQSIVPNNMQAFRNEYERIEYFLRPEHQLININYTIESKINLNCFNQCPED
jgi:hypothetical protein